MAMLAMVVLCFAERLDNGEQDTIAPDADWLFCQRFFLRT